jgi:hypothetical protein
MPCKKTLSPLRKRSRTFASVKRSAPCPNYTTASDFPCQRVFSRFFDRCDLDYLVDSPIRWLDPRRLGDDVAEKPICTQRCTQL